MSAQCRKKCLSDLVHMGHLRQSLKERGGSWEVVFCPGTAWSEKSQVYTYSCSRNSACVHQCRIETWRRNLEGSRKEYGEGNSTPLQYSCLENPMDRGAWWLQSMRSLRVGHTERLHFHFSPSCIGEGNGNSLQCSCLENPRGGGAWWAAICGVAHSWT